MRIDVVPTVSVNEVEFGMDRKQVRLSYYVNKSRYYKLNATNQYPSRMEVPDYAQISY